MPRSNPEAVTLTDILITEALSRRAPRSPNWQAEAEAMRSIAQQMAQASENLLQTLVDTALELCAAGTTGVSLLETTPEGAESFRAQALAGTLAHQVGGSTLRNFCPCGVCLDQSSPVLFSHPDRYFTDFQEVNTPIVEALVLPLVADSHVLGTIWIMSHDEERHFDSEDVRVMTSLADFTATALLLQQRQTGELLAANVVLETEIIDSKETEARLSEAQRRLELSLKSANLGTWTYRVATDEFWADDRALLLQGHAPGEAKTFAEAGMNIHPDDYDRGQAAFATAIQTRANLEIEYRVVWRDRSVHWVASYAEFVPGDRPDEGVFYGVVQDITVAKRDQRERLQTETALRETETRLRVMIQHLPGGAAFVVDRNLRYLLAEGEALSIAGFKPGDLVGKTIAEAMPPELVARYEAVYRSGLAGEAFEFEHDAHDRFYISRGTPLRSENGEIYAVLAVSYDITDRKAAEIALRESEARLQSIANLVPDLLWESEPSGSTNWYNQRWMEYTGQTFEQAIGWDWMNAIHPDDREGSVRRYQEAVEQGMPLQQEHRIRRQDGAYRWFVVKASPLKNERGKVIKMYGAATDIHEQRVSLEALRESEAKYRSLFESIEEGFCIVELIDDDAGQAVDYRFLEVNPIFERLTGIKNVRGKTDKELNINTEAHWLENYDRVARTGAPMRLENYHEATKHWYQAYISRVGGEGSRQIAIIFDDISDRKRYEANLAFLAEVSHDLARLTDIDETMTVLGEKIGGYFNLSACVFAELSETAETAVIDYTWQLSHMPSFSGTYRMQDFVAPEVLQLCRAGEAVVIRDVFADRLVDGEQYAALSIGSFLSIPLIRDDEWRFLLVIYHSEPHDWRDDEIELTHELANRIWTRLERARAEASLVESEQKYRSLFESIDEGVSTVEAIFDEQGKAVNYRYLENNPAVKKIFGFEWPVGKTVREFLPEVEDYWIETIGGVARTGESVRTGYTVESLGKWISAYFSRVGGSDSRRVAAVYTDITDRKRLEQRQAYMLQLSDALRSLSDAVEIQATVTRTTMNLFGTDRCYYCEIIDGDIIIRRDAAREDLPSVVGVYPLENSPIFKAMLDAGQPFAVEDVHTTDMLGEDLRQACFQLQIISFILVPVIKQGEPVGILSINQTTPRNWTTFEVDLAEEIADRTWATIERIRAEAALRESELQRVREQAAREQERQRAETLAELDRAKTLFFSNVSHEFRTPLTLSLAPLQDALSDRAHPLNPVHRERLELVHRNSLRLLKLVNTLLDFSRIEAGRMEAVYEPTDLATYTAELASVFRSAIERADLQLIVDCPLLPEPVFVDREMWEKIVLNLLSNAFKFTFEGEIRVSLHSIDRHQAILQIQDTGTGIAPEHLPHLFERFYQVRGAQARTHEGSGIGLALVHELVRLQGGTIEVTSAIGVGTCFTIALPFGTDHLPSDRLQDEGDRQPIRTLASTAVSAAAYVEDVERSRLKESGISESPFLHRVLLVDDNADMREYLTRILSEYVQVEAIADGATALAAAQAQVPDLILSDVMMPGLDGFELLQALRADPRTREIPIILLSARAGEEAIVEGLEAGADDYLIKPFSTQELVSRITAHLQTAKQRGEALQEARSTLRSQDEFISVVSHELNTPLVSILGWTRLLRSSPPNPTLLSKALDTIERNATLQGKLVQDLLDFSRISAGKLRLNPHPIELQSVIETAIATVSQTAVDKGIDLTWQDTVTEPVVVTGDSDRLSQVLINLLANAIKFTSESGSVLVELSTMNNDGSHNVSCAEIRVIDTGIGIAANFLPRVFDRFSQAQGANAAKGLGLGLAIARHIVELHNGTIHAGSAGEGQGATFTIRLPLLPSRNDFNEIQPRI